eukprot:gene13139-13269_t
MFDADPWTSATEGTVCDIRQENDAAIRNALAKYVFLAAPQRVKLESGIDQSGVLSSQAVVTYRASGITSNDNTVLANCELNIKPSGFLGILDSPLEKEVKKATRSW